VPLWVHEVRVEQAWSARHCQDEGSVQTNPGSFT
jgi:hypothetical protein